ncbi:uncharacterized protein LOC130052989 [Ostrea edulis]|uniref:uncharacterized protein LOC130052989 n=1 Tax=Ostrea edulis TaxID=37623 RepID=UPI0024AF0F44|nr:uncharacterized protein LOC130052989 [Ostrea edulis]
MNPEVFVQPSVILLNSDKDFMSFGDEANDKYLNSESHDIIDGHHYFRNFSILETIPNLRNCKDKRFADQKGRNVKLSKVFIETFTYLKKEISEKAEKKFPNMSITHWILCVPPTWKKDAVEFLKSAAEQAGITTNLQVVNEHKAVLRWWFSEKGGQENKDGTFLFVDLGGGITKVYGVTSGGEWIASNDTPGIGGLSVLKEFQRYMEKVFTPEVYEDFRANYRKDSFNLNLDIIRTIFSHERDTTILQRSSHFEKLKKVFRHINVDKEAPNLDFQDIDDILLKPLKQNIEEGINKAVIELPSNGTVFVFGGASKSDILYEYVKSLLKDTSSFHVERFEHPDMAIIGGSIIEGINLKK